MTIHLEYTAQLRRAAGTARETVSVPEAATLSAALRAAAASRKDDFRRLLFTADGRVQPVLLIFRGDEPVVTGADPLLREGETITVMSPISGG